MRKESSCRMLPLLGFSSPFSSRSSVVFPLPFGPNQPHTHAGGIMNEYREKACDRLPHNLTPSA